MPVVPEHIYQKYKGRTRAYIIARAEEYWAAKRKPKVKAVKRKPKKSAQADRAGGLATGRGR